MVRANLKHFLFIREMMALGIDREKLSFLFSFEWELRRVLIFSPSLQSYNILLQGHKFLLDV